MKLVILSLIIMSTLADKLQRNYLPPSVSSSADGAEFLTAPSREAVTFTSFKFDPHTLAQNLNTNSRFRNLETFSSGQHIPIIRFANDKNGEGSYRFAYETVNNIVHEEEGHQEILGHDQSNVVHGSYSYQSPEGHVFTVNYIADENGFRASGDHLPTSPPIPETIAKSLSFNSVAKNTVATASNENSEVHELGGIDVGKQLNEEAHKQFVVPFRHVNDGYNY